MDYTVAIVATNNTCLLSKCGNADIDGPEGMEGLLDFGATCYGESAKEFGLSRMAEGVQGEALAPSRILERLDEVVLDRHVESHSADLASFHHYGPLAIYGQSSGHAPRSPNSYPHNLKKWSLCQA